MGPSLEYGAIAPFLSNEPTVMTSSALPGVPIVPGPALFPAAMKRAIPSAIILLPIRLTDSSSEEVHSIAPGPPKLMLAARILNSCFLSTVHSIPAITVENEPEPPESSTLTPTNCA